MHTPWRIARLSFPILSLGACAGSAGNAHAPSPAATLAPALTCAPVAPAPPPPSAGTASGNVTVSYVGVFDALARNVEAHHAFATGQRARWDAARRDLRREVEAAKTREEALVALSHVQNALGDRHCYLSPPSDLRSTRLGLGLRLFAEDGGGRRARVAEVQDAEVAAGETGVRAGDDVVAVDGVPLAAWLDAHRWESSSQNAAVQRREQVNAIVAARAPWTQLKSGDARTLRLRRGERTWDRILTFVHPRKWEETSERGFDDAPPMKSIGCRSDKTALYTDFELTAVGTNVCVYRPKPGTGKADTRLVRFVSFLYDHQGEDEDALRAARADHVLLTRELRGAGAVVLDVHENHGGNNPFVFLSWFADRAWDHQTVHVKVSADFSEDDTRQFLYGDKTLMARYARAVADKQAEVSWPFLCTEGGKVRTDGTCEARGPRPEERVTKARIAIVTGPECTSSCDAIVADWTTFHMGPVVGLQPAHGFTSIRHAYPLVGPDGRDLGRFRIALSWEGYPRNGTPLEGAALHLDWEAPYTFETRDTWVDLSVKEARRRAEGGR